MLHSATRCYRAMLASRYYALHLLRLPPEHAPRAPREPPVLWGRRPSMDAATRLLSQARAAHLRPCPSRHPRDGALNDSNAKVQVAAELSLQS